MPTVPVIDANFQQRGYGVPALPGVQIADSPGRASTTSQGGGLLDAALDAVSDIAKKKEIQRQKAVAMQQKEQEKLQRQFDDSVILEYKNDVYNNLESKVPVYLQSRKGKNVLDREAGADYDLTVTDEIAKQVQDYQKYSKIKPRNKYQKAHFDAINSQVGQRLISGAQNHQLAEMEKHQDNVDTDAININYVRAGTDPTAENLRDILNSNKNILRKQADRNGLSSEQFTYNLIKSNTQIGDAAINSLLANDQPEEAEKLLAEAKRTGLELNPDKVSTWTTQIKAHTLVLKAGESADNIMATIGRIPNRMINLADADAIAREQIKDPTLYKETMSAVKAQVGIHNDGVKLNEERNYNTLLGRFVGGKTLAKIKLMPEFELLNGENQNKMVKDLEGQEDHRLKVVSAVSDEDKQNIANDQAMVYQQYLDNSDQVKMIAPEVALKGGSITDAHYNNIKELDRKPYLLPATKRANDFINSIGKSGMWVLYPEEYQGKNVDDVPVDVRIKNKADNINEATKLKAQALSWQKDNPDKDPMEFIETVVKPAYKEALTDRIWRLYKDYTPAGQAIKRLSAEGNAPTQPAAATALPPAVGNQGKIIRDTETGKRLKSDGKTWIEVQ